MTLITSPFRLLLQRALWHAGLLLVLSVVFAHIDDPARAGLTDERCPVITVDNAGLMEERAMYGRGIVNHFALAPDGSTLAVASTTGVWLHDFDTLADRAFLRGHTDQVAAVAFNGDGSALVSGGWDDTVRIWDTATGTQQNVLTDHEGWVLDAAFSPDASRLYSASRDSSLRVWDAAEGSLIGQWRTSIFVSIIEMSQVEASADGRFFATADGVGRVTLWDANDYRRLGAFDTDSIEVSALAFSPDGSLLAMGNSGSQIFVWDTATNEQRWLIAGGASDIKQLAFSPDGTRLAAATQDGVLAVWEMDSGALIHALSGSQYQMAALVWSADGTRLLSGSSDGALRRWDSETGALLATHWLYNTGFYSVATSPDNRWLAAGGWGDALYLWNMETGTEKRLALDVSVVRRLEFSPDSATLTAQGAHRDVFAFDVATGAGLESSEPLNLVAAISSDGRLTALPADSSIQINDTASGAPVQTLRGYTNAIQALAFSPDDRYLASASADNTIRLWNLKTGEQLFSTDAVYYPQAVAFSPDGTLLAGTGWGSSVRVWSVPDGEQLAALRGHTGYNYGLTWSEDGTALISASQDGSARIWSPPCQA